MTKYAKYRALSIAAGVVSLFFALSFVTEPLTIAYDRWSFLKLVRDLGLVANPSAIPHLTGGNMASMALKAVIAILAYRLRSRLRQKMLPAQASART